MKVRPMKTIYKLFAVLAVLAIALVPIIAAEDSDAAVKRVGQCEVSGFTDYDRGTLKITLNNDDVSAVNVKVRVYDFGDHDTIRAETDSELAANSDTTVSLSWGYGSSGTKYVDVYVYDSNDDTVVLAQENCVEIDVSHSIWKNSVTYIVIVVIIIIVVIAIILFIRSGKKTRADSTMADRTFTKMHRERTAKKSATAQKKEYTSSGNRSRKSK